MLNTSLNSGFLLQSWLVYTILDIFEVLGHLHMCINLLGWWDAHTGVNRKKIPPFISVLVWNWPNRIPSQDWQNRAPQSTLIPWKFSGRQSIHSKESSEPINGTHEKLNNSRETKTSWRCSQLFLPEYSFLVDVLWMGFKMPQHSPLEVMASSPECQFTPRYSEFYHYLLVPCGMKGWEATLGKFSTIYPRVKN